MRQKRCSYCGLISDGYNIYGRHICAFSSCPLRNKRKNRTMKWTAIAMMATAMAIVLTYFLSPAHASECYSIRDYSKRMECLSIERGEPADCLGVRDPDRRIICRSKAERGRRSREWGWRP
jgi:hypothetical protein